MTERAKYWADQLDAWERSGLSQAEFCRRHGIKRVTLGWWKRQLRGPSGRMSKRRRRAAKLSKSFVELTGSIAFSAPTYEVVLAGDRAIRVPAKFDPHVLSRLISAVESC